MSIYSRLITMYNLIYIGKLIFSTIATGKSPPEPFSPKSCLSWSCSGGNFHRINICHLRTDSIVLFTIQYFAHEKNCLYIHLVHKITLQLLASHSIGKLVYKTAKCDSYKVYVSQTIFK